MAQVDQAVDVVVVVVVYKHQTDRSNIVSGFYWLLLAAAAAAGCHVVSCRMCYGPAVVVSLLSATGSSSSSRTQLSKEY